MALPSFLSYLLGQDFSAPASEWTFDYWTPQELLLEAQGGIPDVVGSGASSIAFSDVGTAEEVFEGSGASQLAFADSGAGLEVFEGSGASQLVFTDVGSGLVLVDVIGSGASELAFTDSGTGTFTEAPGEQVYGGGFSWHDDRKKTIKEFERRLRPKKPKRVQRPEERTPDVFSYVSESEIHFTDAGQGTAVVATQGAGASSFRLAGHGTGRFEESAADILRLLLTADEI